MANEQEKTLEALKTAIQMEVDGKSYYHKMAEISISSLGSQLFDKLSIEEDDHRRRFEEIYEVIQKKKNWPKSDFAPDGGRALRNIFARAAAEDIKPTNSELKAIETAMAMENKTFDFYTKQSKSAAYPLEKSYYESLARQEREHNMVLLDYFEYIKNPAGWFVNKEHHSLDGG